MVLNKLPAGQSETHDVHAGFLHSTGGLDVLVLLTELLQVHAFKSEKVYYLGVRPGAQPAE